MEIDLKKILFIVPEYPFGGAERQIFELAKQGQKFGFRAEILDVKSKTDRMVDEIKINAFSSDILLENYGKFLKNIFRISCLFKISSYIKQNNYDMVCLFNKLFLPLAFMGNKNLLFSVREFETKYFKSIYKMMIKKIKTVTTNNLPSYIFVKQFHKNAHLVNNILHFKSTSTITLNNNKEFLAVCNIAKHKNILPILQTFKSLKKDGYKLKVAGKITDLTYFNKIKIYFSENIEYLGYLDLASLSKEYINCEAIIHLSLKEGTPNVILDSVKYGKPFIIMDIPENISFTDTFSPFLLNNDSLQNVRNKVNNLHKIIDNDPREVIEYLEFLQIKLKNNYSEKNAEVFYTLL